MRVLGGILAAAVFAFALVAAVVWMLAAFKSGF